MVRFRKEMLALLSVGIGIFVVHVECDGMREVECLDGGWWVLVNQIWKSMVSMGTSAFSVRSHQQSTRFESQQSIRIGEPVCCVLFDVPLIRALS